MINYKIAPKGDCVLSHCSKYNRNNPSEAKIDPPLPLEETKEQSEHELLFPQKV